MSDPRTTVERRERTAEHRERLWWLTASPVMWVAHLLASYGTAALWCGKIASRTSDLGVARWLIFAYTIVALAGVLAIGLRGYHRHTFGTATLPHDFDSPADRHRFLGFAVLLLSGLSAVAIAYVALAAIFVGSCR